VAKYSNNGAFEILMGETTIFSKIERGAMPKAEDLVEPLKAMGFRYTGN